MVQTLEAIRGGGGSIKVGTTGTISALMSRELQSTSTRPCDSAGDSTPRKLSAGDSTPRKLKPMDEASSSKSKVPEIVRKTKPYTGRSHQAPMLTSDNISIDGTPIKEARVFKIIRALILEISFQVLVRECVWLVTFCNIHHRTNAWQEPASAFLLSFNFVCSQISYLT